MGFNLGSILGTATSKTAGGILDGVTNAVNSIFNTAGDKDKMAQFNSTAQQAIQAELDKHNEFIVNEANRQRDAELLDDQNARQMEMAVAEAKSSSWLEKNIVPILAIFVEMIWGSLTVYLLLNMLNLISINPNVNMTALLGVYSGLCGIAGVIVNFYFGSSKSSQLKDDTISKIAQQP